MNHPQIKICGLTCPEEALKCAELGADAIGLVFFKKSPRNLTEERAAEITRGLPKTVVPTGVFVNEPFDFIMNKVNRCGLRAVQLHGNETPDLVDRLKSENLNVIKVLYMKSEPCISMADHFSPTAFLVEYATGVIPGGNALSWNVEDITILKTEKPIIIAGGLTPATIKQAVLSSKPDGVDVSSGVEKEPGRKDLFKVEAFIKAVRSCDMDKKPRRIF